LTVRGRVVKWLLIIAFAISGLVLVAWPFEVFATLLGVSPHIQLPDGRTVYEEATDISFVVFFVYLGVWGVSLFFARKAIKEPARRSRATIWTLAPFAWLVVFGYIGNTERNGRNGESIRAGRKIGLLTDRIKGSDLSLSGREAALQSLVGYTRDPDPLLRYQAIAGLGRSAAVMPEQDKGTAVRILTEELLSARDDDRVASILALEKFGADAQPALDALLRIANGTNDKVEAEFAIMSLAGIGRSVPARVVPALVAIVRRAHQDGTGVYQATFAVTALRQFHEETSEIVPAISACSELPVPPSHFFASEFLEAWLLTMTALDPSAIYYDHSALDRPIIVLLGEPNAYRRHTALSVVAKLKNPAPEVLNAVEAVAKNGGTAQIRAEAQSVLTAARMKGVP
jgi:hypothetical protein